MDGMPVKWWRCRGLPRSRKSAAPAHPVRLSDTAPVRGSPDATLLPRASFPWASSRRIARTFPRHGRFTRVLSRITATHAGGRPLVHALF